MNVERKLTAIMFTDIAGYTQSMSKNETIAISMIHKKEAILKPLIKNHNGTYVKCTGDGSLSYFNSAVDAAMCAKKFQESIYNDDSLNVRIGIHLGDTIFEKGDIRGDGVNIASRLESMAVEGGVFISKEVQDQLLNQKDFDGVSIGLQSMKGVGRLIEVFALKGTKLTQPNPREYQESRIAKHSGDEVPSIAIIPFENKGTDEDVFYAYGISADLISYCSGAGLIRVAGLKDIEKLDYANLKYEELSEKLFVRYITQGTLWKMDNIFQLSVELYDTKESKVIWSDRWQENWENLSSIKTNLSDGLLKALNTISQVKRKSEFTNPEDYEFYFRGKHKYDKRQNIDDIEISRDLLSKAIELDNNLIIFKVQLGKTYMESGFLDKAMEIFTLAFKQAKELDDEDGMAISLIGIGSVHADKGDLDIALEYLGRALEICKKLNMKTGIAANLNSMGTIYKTQGNFDKALNFFTKSLTIYRETGDKCMLAMLWNNISTIYIDQGNVDEGLDFLTKSLTMSEEIGDKDRIGSALNNMSIVYIYKGEHDKALHYGKKSLIIREKIDDKEGMVNILTTLASIYSDKGEYDKTLDFGKRALSISSKSGYKRGTLYVLNNLGIAHFHKGDYYKAEECLVKSLYIQKKNGFKNIELESTTYLYLCYKYIGKEYDVKEVYNLIKDDDSREFELNLSLYRLLGNQTYLKAAYNQIQEIISRVDDVNKILKFPTPKSIIEEYNKVFKK